MITTPLFSMITAIFLKFISNELIVTRFLNAVMLTLVLYFIYKSMQELKVSESLSHFVITIVVFITSTLFTFSYNILILLFSVIIIYLELKYRENIDFEFSRDFLLGLFAGFAICTKQTIGLLLFCGVVACSFIFVKDIKLFLKKVCSRTIGAIIPILVLVIYLALNNALYDFYDYCFLGLQSFNNYDSYINFVVTSPVIFAKVLAILGPLMIIIALVNIVYDLKKKKECNHLIIILVYGFIMLFGNYPIADYNHFITFIHPTFLIITYYIYVLIRRFLKYAKLVDIITIIITIVVTIGLLYGCIDMYNKKYNTYNINHFKGIPISEGLYKDILFISGFVSKNDVLILDSEAVMYMIPADKYHKNYDMLNRGNFGSKGEEGIKEDLKKRNEYVLILNEKYNLNWQVPKDIIEFVKNNMKKTGSILIYDVYKW